MMNFSFFPCTVISPKPIDQEQKYPIVQYIIIGLTVIILVLITVIFAIARNKRSRSAGVLDVSQHNLNANGLGLSIDKRMNCNFKVSVIVSNI
jgi:hypothetical protein